MSEPIKIHYFSDVLCIWAYATHRRSEQLIQKFGDRIALEPHYCSIFPDAHTKIRQNWKDRGTFEGFNRHVNEVAAQFPHITVRPDLWLSVRPRTSMTAHIFLKAIHLIDMQSTENESWCQSQSLSRKADWAVRLAFFADGKDISNWDVLHDIANAVGVDQDKLMQKLHTSEAVAALGADLQAAQNGGVDISPTYLMNEGRQKLTGNVSYQILDANVNELLRMPGS